MKHTAKIKNITDISQLIERYGWEKEITVVETGETMNICDFLYLYDNQVVEVKV